MKAYTDLEQSKKLAEFLPLESADMYYFGIDDYPNSPYQYHELMFGVIDKEDMEDFLHIPCWSLAALLDVLPDTMLGKDKDGYVVMEETMGSGQTTFASNSIDACYEMILKLHDKNLI